MSFLKITTNLAVYTSILVGTSYNLYGSDNPNDAPIDPKVTEAVAATGTDANNSKETVSSDKTTIPSAEEKPTEPKSLVTEFARERNNFLEERHTIPPCTIQHLKSCHKTASRLSAWIISAARDGWNHASTEEKVHIVEACFCTTTLGGHVVPGFLESLLCCAGMTTVCALTEEETRNNILNRIQEAPPVQYMHKKPDHTKKD